MTERQTEVGAIPEGWIIVNLEEITTKIGDGIHATPNYSNNGEYYFINGNNIRDGRIIITEETKNVDISEFKRYRKDLGESTVLLSINGTIGNLALYRGEPVILGKSVAYLNIRDQIEKTYLHHALQTDLVANQFNDGITGTTINNLGLGTIRNTQIALPPLPEQRAIATALSDADGLIGALDALIEKKWAIKQAAMQQLLTGKKRLPGFEGEWETKRLGDILTFLPTANNPRADLTDDGDIQYIHYGDVHAQTKSILDCNVCALPFIDRRKVGSATYLEDGDLIMVDASEDLEGTGKSVEIQGISGRNVIAGLHTISCRGNSNQWAKGFKAYLQFTPAFKSALTRIATGISVYAISKKQIAEIELALPSVPEQEAIVSILSDMDAEIAALERRREKAKQIKQGMMQQLLTGRVRLVEPPEAAA